MVQADPSPHGTQSAGSAVNQLYQPYTSGAGDPRMQSAAASVDPRYAPSVPYTGPPSVSYTGPPYAAQQTGFGSSRAKSSEEVSRAYRQPGVRGYRSTADVESGRMDFDRSRNMNASSYRPVETGMQRAVTQPLWNQQRAPAVSFTLALINFCLLLLGRIAILHM